MHGAHRMPFPIRLVLEQSFLLLSLSLYRLCFLPNVLLCPPNMYFRRTLSAARGHGGGNIIKRVAKGKPKGPPCDGLRFEPNITQLFFLRTQCGHPTLGHRGGRHGMQTLATVNRSLISQRQWPYHICHKMLRLCSIFNCQSTGSL